MGNANPLTSLPSINWRMKGLLSSSRTFSLPPNTTPSYNNINNGIDVDANADG